MATRHLFHAAAATVCAIGAALAVPKASAIEVDSGDYTAMPDGATAFIFDGQYAERMAVYGNGNKVAIHSEREGEVGIARLPHVVRIDDPSTVDPQCLLPFGELRAESDAGPYGHIDEPGLFTLF